ncbi:conserved hypothetical protein [Catenulispora acidiphila DSM 44928]|uniref:DUF2617 domain-containing protein n=1 Tax=Catenulispora acidiphila (strain DSM 44928 / JCM 14897 / NBRC 102108 / NRRL B-24433 / ID139908) TaxID=479433 RepID=C7PWX5_CATAD|nr:DUF2617 family protein [Catenulispora acidiphila]ACU77232.1 conserved hypothetical protein [Catenulispora acidiphila DSM 44928]
MIAPLSVPYRDVRASELSWSLDAPDQPPLHSGRHPVGGLDVEVRILGASHQILVRTAGHGLLLCRETVACRDAAPGPLPIAIERELDDGYHYEVRCEVREVDTGHFPAWASALRDYADALPDATIAVFPASPDAVTAVVVEPLPSGLHGVLWRTWHTYPHAGGGGDVVATRTVLYLAPPSGGAGGGMPGLRP